MGSPPIGTASIYLMLARLQQFTTLSLICAAAGWAAYFLSKGHVGLAGVGVLLILLGYALFLAVEFSMLAFVRKDDPAPRASARQLVDAWWAEVLTAPQVFFWRQPFRSHAEPDSVPPGTAGQRGVVLIHGFVCNRAFWNPWLARLRSASVPFVAVNLEPVFGSIDNYVDIIEQAVRRLESATGQAPVLVAHSMGGLAVRAWLSGPGNDSRAHHIITIGTPHHGTWLARFGHTANGKQMRVNSPWLSGLARRDLPERFARFTCFYSHCDNIVFPASTATLSGASNQHVPGAAHVHLAFHEAPFAELLRWVLPQAPDRTRTQDSASPRTKPTPHEERNAGGAVP
jgi:triacylglycerol lipase